MNAEPTRPRHARIRRATIVLALWTAAWLLTLALATFGPLALWAGNHGAALLGVGMNIVAGLGMIRANKRHLEVQDELHQRIHLEAMSLTLGLAMVVGLAAATLASTGVLGSEPRIAHLVFFIGLTYLASIVALNQKYR